MQLFFVYIFEKVYPLTPPTKVYTLYDIFFFLSSKLRNPIGLFDARVTTDLASWAPLLLYVSRNDTSTKATIYLQIACIPVIAERIGLTVDMLWLQRRLYSHQCHNYTELKPGVDHRLRKSRRFISIKKVIRSKLYMLFQ